MIQLINLKQLDKSQKDKAKQPIKKLLDKQKENIQIKQEKMTDQSEENFKENINSSYPKMDLKSLGAEQKTQNKVRRNSSLSNSEAVKEDEQEVIENEDNSQMTKSKFKHVNIMTDSDEFNQHRGEQTLGIPTTQSQQLQRLRSASNNEQVIGESIQEDKVQEDKTEEENQNRVKAATSKLSMANHVLEDSIIVDRGEFDCSTPTRPKSTPLLKKIGSSINYNSHFTNQDEIIAEDPEKETDGLQFARITSYKEIKIKVDEVDTDNKPKSFTPRHKYADYTTSIMEETKEDEGQEGNKAFQTAKQERQQEKDYIKKIVKGDQVPYEGEKKIHYTETSGMTSHMHTNQINEDDQDEDPEDEDNSQ